MHIVGEDDNCTKEKQDTRVAYGQSTRKGHKTNSQKSMKRQIDYYYIEL